MPQTSPMNWMLLPMLMMAIVKMSSPLEMSMENNLISKTSYKNKTIKWKW